MLIAAQGFDGIFKGIGDAADAFAGAFALLFALAALAAFVGKIIVSAVCAVSTISLLVHGGWPRAPGWPSSGTGRKGPH